MLHNVQSGLFTHVNFDVVIVGMFVTLLFNADAVTNLFASVPSVYVPPLNI